MTIINNSVTPTCRYSHGELIKIGTPKNEKGEQRQYGLTLSGQHVMMFVGDLYVCPTCGYTEFFDNEPQVTLANNTEGRNYGAN